MRNTPLYIKNIPKPVITAFGMDFLNRSEYPGVKHNSWENAGREKALLPWLFAQRLQAE